MEKERRSTVDRSKLIKRLLVIALVVWLGKTYIGQGITMKELKAKKVAEETKITALEREIENLNTEIGNKDSLEFIEKVAREDHFMVKPREIIFINKNKKDNKNNFLVPRSK